MNELSQISKSLKIALNQPWWKGATIYQIYPRSYYDSNNDGIGDLPGITQKLEHIASLGVDGIWISPIFTSPMRDFGYDVADYCGIDPMFGTLADFDALLARAHELGLKVIIDQVYSHSSNQHKWFEESRQSRDNPKSDWYVWVDAKPDGSPPNNWQSVFYGPSWTWDARRGQYYFHNFLPEQPDLNLHNPKVQDAILDVARFWLDKGVDGFRLDAINFSMHNQSLADNPPNPEPGPRTRPFDFQLHTNSMSQPEIVGFVDKLAGVINSYSGRFSVAEVGGANPEKEMRSFIEGRGRLNTAYSFHYLYAPELTPILVKEALAKWPARGEEYWPSWAFSNHDAPRAVTRWSKGRDTVKMAKLINALLAAHRGNLFLYQGEELGLEQAEVPFHRLVDPEAIMNWPQTLGRDGARTPMPWNSKSANAGFGNHEPWLPVDVRHYACAVDSQISNDSVLNFTRNLLAFRQSQPLLLWGDIECLHADENLLIIERSLENKKIYCVFNLGFENIGYAIPEGISNIEFSFNGASLNELPPMAGIFLSE